MGVFKRHEFIKRSVYLSTFNATLNGVFSPIKLLKLGGRVLNILMRE